MNPDAVAGAGTIVIALAVGVGGYLGWRALSGGLRRLEPADTAPEGVTLWLLGLLVFHLSFALLLEQQDASLVQILGRQTFAALASAAVLLGAAALRRVPTERLGLRRHHGSSPLLLGVCAWLAFLPVFAALGAINQWLQGALGQEAELQRYLQLFEADGGARGSLLVWTLMVVVLPLYEEVLFRGALYGGLRRLLHPAAAVVLSGLMFGLAHGEFSVALLPATALGMMLCVLYERTASLAVPVIFHAVQNGFVLVLITATSAAGGATS